MNKKMKMFIICAIFALIISCKNFATGKDLKQSAKEQVQGFVDKILDPIKDKIASNDPEVDEIAEKLQEEEKKVNSGEGENEKAIDSGKDQKEEDKEGNEQAPILGEKKEKNTEEDRKIVNLGEKEAGVKKETKEDEDKEKVEEQKQKEKRAQEKRQRQEKKAQEKRQRQEERKRKRQEQQEKRRAENKIKTLTDKIDRVNGNIDNIEHQTSVKPKAVIDKITGPVYDDFVDGKNSIRTTWGDLEEEGDSGLGKLLEELSDARDALRTKLNKDNKKYYANERNEPPLKENVGVSEIQEDLEKVKSKLGEVKGYLKDNSNFEEIKEYISESRSLNK
ncbi:ErpC protein [Borreliella burgdorferi]|uniref:ErpC protein n=1 Tax=Borreliella burgdorferi TaxID=139 RepID=UPI001E56C3B1|nr:ErpC protein [Borreliella burgdorferi]MCD2393575.1 ErpC protein [Borreliella burgdorferi]